MRHVLRAASTLVLATAINICMLPNRAGGQDDGLPPPKITPKPRPPAPSEDDVLEGRAEPKLVWPKLPQPLAQETPPPAPPPPDKMGFCSQQEQLDYEVNTFNPVLKQASEGRSRARQYQFEVGQLAQQIRTELAARQKKPIETIGDEDELAKLKEKASLAKTAESRAEAFLEKAGAVLDIYMKYSDLVHKAQVVECTCPSVQLMKGLAITQFDSRGKPHLPASKEFHYAHNKPRDAGYYELAISVRPQIGGGCQPSDSGKAYVSFPLFGGAGVVNEYFTVKLVNGEMPHYFYPEQLMAKMRLTFDTGKSLESEHYSQSIEVPEGAKRLDKLEMWFLDGAFDAKGNGTTAMVSWP